MTPILGGAPARVLLADNNTDLRQALKHLLSPYWTVEAVADGTAALETALCQPPDLVLADSRLRGLDGFELLRRLRTHPATREIPILLLLADAAEEAYVEDLEAGADDYLIKPISTRKLLARVRTYLELARVRREATRKLWESQERFRVLVEAASQAVWETNAEGVVVSDSPSWRAYTGQRLEEWLGCGWVNAVHPDDRQYAEWQWREAVAAGRNVNAEFRLRSPDGGWRWTNVRAAPLRNADGSILKWVGMNLDITERKQAEEALKEEHARLKATLDVMPVGVWIVDSNGRAVLTNEHGKIIWGEPPRPISSTADFGEYKGWWPGTGKALRGEDWAICRVLATGETIRDQEINIQRFNASKGTILNSAAPIRDDQGRLLGGVAIEQDITEYKQAEEVLRENEARQAFLLKLSDALRTLSDPIDIQGEASKILCEHLNATHCYYAEFRDGMWFIEHEYRISGPSFIGQYRTADPPIISAPLLAGGPLVVTSMQAPGMVSEAELHIVQALRIHGCVVFPLVKGGSLRATLNVVQSEPREWTAAEIMLIEETAERTWAAVERARAEEAVAADLRDTQLLRDLGVRLVSESQLQVLYQEIVGVAIALTGADAGTLQIFDTETQELVLLATQGFERQMTEHFSRVSASSNTPCGLALVNNERTYVDFDAPEAEDPDGSLRMHVEAGYRSAQSTPLVTRLGRPIGMVSTHWRERCHRPTERELRFLDLLARQAADFIEQRQAEAALRASELRLQKAMDIDTVGVLFFSLDGCVTDANAAFERMTGYTREELRTIVHWKILTPPEFRDVTARAATELGQRGKTAPYEKQLIRKDGTRWWGLSAPVRLEEKGPNSLCAEFILDITERKQAEKALRDADRRKDEFLAMLAHELRNPLTPIRSGLHVLRKSADQIPTAARIHAMMERQVDHLVRLVDDLLEVSRITRSKIELRKERVDLAAILDNAIDLSQPLIAAEGHQLTRILPPDPLWLKADPVRLAQVFANLLNNAAKYTAPGGQIHVTVERQGGKAVVSIRDTGAGIPPEMLPRVFDLFTQVNRSGDRAQSGLGIGLFLVRRLVELHGGRVEARSDGPGQGSEFVVSLPLVATLAEEATTAARSASAPGAAQRVLVVDDSPDVADSTGLLLGSLGIEVQVVYDGPAALQSLATFQPAVVLLDLGMPGMDGFEVARRIRQHPAGQAITLVALTGWGQEQDRRRTRQAGFDQHLVKPVDPEALQAFLASLKNEHR